MTSRIGGFLVKRVMVDQGSGVEIMYPNLYKGLRLKPKDLSKYDTPLIGFDGRMVTPEGQIKLPVVTMGNEVIKFPMEDGVAVVRADQKMARQCLVVAINHKIKQKEQVDREPL